MISAANIRVTALKSHSREWLFCIFALLLLGACDRSPVPVQLAGGTMGTTWHVTYIASADAPAAAVVQGEIEARLERVNQSMSTYLQTSEISRFNRLAADSSLQVSADFSRVLAAALEVGRKSGGAYDVTVAPLVELWGFGATGAVLTPPAAQEIETLLARVGQDNIALDESASTVRKREATALDFSSLAKGFAVDEVARGLQQQGVDRFLVEVGGEMRLSGFSARGDLWRVAIEQPDSSARSAAIAVSLTDAAVATSGDYRNFFELDGRRYSHSIDPRTGKPVAHDLVSVTVVHPSAMYADAWATALIVLGAEQAAVVAREQGLAVYFIRRTEDGFEHSNTQAFAPYLSAPQPGV